MTGRCDLIPSDADFYSNPGVMGELIAMILPFSIILISYGYLLLFFCTSYRQLKASNSKMQSEFRTTWTLFFTFLIPGILLCGLYLLDFIRVSNDGTVDMAYKVMELLYMLPYGTNFFLYLSSTQYRMAFTYFLKQIKNFILRKRSRRELDDYVNTDADLKTYHDIERIPTHFA